jgi:hypothetical protein
MGEGRGSDKVAGLEYDLKIDEQVAKFLESKQKLTYFLITASVAVIAFVLDFVLKNRETTKGVIYLVTASGICGTLTAGLSLLNISMELKSFNLHLRYRYQKKTWGSLSPEEQKEWERVNKHANTILKLAFVSLFGEITLAIIFFIVLLGSPTNKQVSSLLLHRTSLIVGGP